jgi:hypothetical protein
MSPVACAAPARAPKRRYFWPRRVAAPRQRRPHVPVLRQVDVHRVADVEQLARGVAVLRDDQAAAVRRCVAFCTITPCTAVEIPTFRDFSTMIRTGRPAARCCSIAA